MKISQEAEQWLYLKSKGKKTTSQAKMFYGQDFKEQCGTLYARIKSKHTHSLSAIYYLFSSSSYIFMTDSKRSHRSTCRWCSTVPSEKDKRKQLYGGTVRGMSKCIVMLLFFNFKMTCIAYIIERKVWQLFGMK